MDEIASDDLTQIVMVDLVRQLAATLIALAVHQDRYVMLPSLGTVLMSELAANLTERGVPAQVAAGLLGVSRRSFFRYRAERAKFGHSNLGEIITLLSESPRTKSALLGAMSEADVAALESTLRFLVDRGLVAQINGTYELCQASAGDEVADVETVLETVAANELPLRVAELADELGQDPAFVEQVVGRLADAGRLTIDGDMIVDAGTVEFVSTSHRSTVLGLFHTTRTFLRGVTRRLDRGRDAARTRTWRFSHPEAALLEELIGTFAASMDEAWTTTEPNQPAARSKLTAMLTWWDSGSLPR